MGFRNTMFGVLTVGAIAAGGAAMVSPAWAAEPGGEQACRLIAYKPSTSGATLQGKGERAGCSDTVTYFWVRVYKVIDLYPDGERAVTGSNYVQNTNLTARGSCDGKEEYYTHTSTATGISGDSTESSRVVLC
jgi:hypothetical protein